MDHDKRRDIPIDPSTTETVGREHFKKPQVTDANVDAFVKLDEMGGQGLPPAMAASLKKGASKAMLEGICQEERKRCFLAFAAFLAHKEGRLTRHELLNYMNEFEVNALTGPMGRRITEMIGDPNEQVLEVEAAPVRPALPGPDDEGVK